MNPPNLGELLLRQIVPTTLQTLVALVLSGVIIVASRLAYVGHLLGITSDGVQSLQDALRGHSSGVLGSSVASNIVLVTFWGTVGLLAYLVTWALVNLLIDARNTVTIDTQYANRGHWRGPWQTLGIKAASALAFALVIGTYRSGVVLWLKLAQNAVTSPTSIHIVLGIVAWIGLAVQLYLVYLLVVLTFSPWYRGSGFTE